MQSRRLTALTPRAHHQTASAPDPEPQLGPHTGAVPPPTDPLLDAQENKHFKEALALLQKERGPTSDKGSGNTVEKLAVRCRPGGATGKGIA